jgi:drug/metabolite transporter (DMT)-like permease
LTILLALTGSVVFGGSDFIGALASRRGSPLQVAATAQVTALVFAVPTALLASSGQVTAADAAWSLASGVAVALGLGLFYSAMARGLISLVVPITAVVGAVAPVAWGLASGERPEGATLTGIVLAVVAIAVVSAMPRAGVPVGPSVVVASIAAGLCFGAFLVLVSRASEDAGMWPILFSRMTSSSGLVVLALAFARPPGDGLRATLPASIVVGVLESAGIIALLLALQRGPLSVSSVLLSLYPVVSVLLAMAVLRERLTRHQLIGVALAFCSVILISVQSS